MILTTEDLKKKDYGTACGTVTPMKSKCLSQEIIINYIDEFFGGKIEDVDVYDDELEYGTAFFSKCKVDKSFFDKYVKFIEKNKGYSIDDIADWIDETVDEVKNINLSSMNQKDIICYVFSCLVDCFDGSLRIEAYDDSLRVEIESE